MKIQSFSHLAQMMMARSSVVACRTFLQLNIKTKPKYIKPAPYSSSAVIQVLRIPEIWIDVIYTLLTAKIFTVDAKLEVSVCTSSVVC